MQAPFKAAANPQIILCDCQFTLFDAARVNQKLLDELIQGKANGAQIFLIADGAVALNASWQIDMAMKKAGYAVDALNVGDQKVFDHAEIEDVLRDKGITNIDAVYTARKPDLIKTMIVTSYVSPKAHWDQYEAVTQERTMQPA